MIWYENKNVWIKFWRNHGYDASIWYITHTAHHAHIHVHVGHISMIGCPAYHASSSKGVSDAGGKLPEEMHVAPRQANYSYLSCCNIALSWIIYVAVNTKLAKQHEKAEKNGIQAMWWFPFFLSPTFCQAKDKVPRVFSFLSFFLSFFSLPHMGVHIIWMIFHEVRLVNRRTF